MVSQPAQQDWLRATTPEPFQRRNVFLGGSVLDNKYDLSNLKRLYHLKTWFDRQILPGENWERVLAVAYKNKAYALYAMKRYKETQVAISRHLYR